MRTPAPAKSMNVSATSKIARNDWRLRRINPLVEVRPPSVSDARKSDQRVCRAGANPNNKPAITEIPDVNQSTVALIAMGAVREMLTGNKALNNSMDQ